MRKTQDRTIERFEIENLRSIDKISGAGLNVLKQMWGEAKDSMKGIIADEYRRNFPHGTWSMIDSPQATINVINSIDKRVASVLAAYHHASITMSSVVFKDVYFHGVLRNAWLIDQVTPPSYDVKLPKSPMFKEADLIYRGPESDTAWKVRWSAWMDSYRSALNQNLRLGAMNDSDMADAASEIDATRPGSPQSDIWNAIERIFSNQSNVVYSSAQHDVAEANPDLEIVEIWQTRYYDRVCDICDGNRGLTRDEADSDIPAHPNAVLSGTTMASYGKLQEMVGADYHGPAVLIETAQNHTLTIGPNHPIFTRRGMIKACELTESDELVYDLRSEPGAISSFNFEKMPMVEDVFQSGLSSGYQTSVSSARHDFHGDRIFCKGEIKVIKPADGLLPVFDSGGIEKMRENGFIGPDMQKIVLPSDSPENLGLSRINLPTSGGMSGGLSGNHFILLKIQRIHYIKFIGKAFDASTETGLYNSNGFVVKNCGCYWRLVPRSWISLLRDGDADEQAIAKAMDASGEVPNAMLIFNDDGKLVGATTVEFETWAENKMAPIQSR